MSSLEKQLKRLRIPDSSSLERATKFKKKTSFLFDPKEASDIDNETVFALGLNGLDELKLLNRQFEKYESSIFSESSKHLDRTLQSQMINNKLDSTIKDFLYFLSPYMLLKPAHKTLEWLIRRFQVHLYNVDDLLASAFPYHHSNVFARVVQLLNLTGTKWSWLLSVQKTGSPLPSSTVIQHCISNPAFFIFLSGLLFRMVKTTTDLEFSAYHAFSSFYATTVIGVLEQLEKVSEEIVSSLLAQIIHGLKSNVPDLQAASYMIIGQLTKKCELESSVIESILKIMVKNMAVQHSESLLMCINCLCSSHKIVEFPKVVHQTLYGLPEFRTIFSDLSKQYEMDSFLKVLMFYLIKKSLMHDEESGKENETPLLSLLKDVDVKRTTKIEIIRKIHNEYFIKRRAIVNEEDLVRLDCNVKSIVKIIQKRWQEEMDETIKDYLVSLQTMAISEEEKKLNLKWTQDFVSMALSNIGSQVVCDSGSTLIIALYHPEAEYRKLALEKVSDILKEPMHDSEDIKFLEESLLVKLDDEDPSVVSAVLDLNEGLISVCSCERLVPPLTKLMEKSSQKWSIVFQKALDILLSDEMLEKMSTAKENVLLYLLPFVFLKKRNTDHVKLVVNCLGKSQLKVLWLVKSLLKKSVKEGLEMCSEDSTYEELAVQNSKIICTIAEGMNITKKQSALKTLKGMQDCANEKKDEYFEIMFLLICTQFISTSKDDCQKSDVIDLILPGLLELVSSVVTNEEKTTSVKELESSHGENRGGVPVGLLETYLHMLKRKKEKKLLLVKSKIYLYILENIVKCLRQAPQQSAIWWKISKDSEKQFAKVLLAVFDVVFKGLVKGQDFPFQNDFRRCLETIVKAQFPQRMHFLKFLAFLWSSPARFSDEDVSSPRALVVVQTLHLAKILVQSLNDEEMTEITSEESQVFPSFVVCLTSPITAVRRTTLDLISLIVSRSSVKTSAVCTLGNIVSESSDEIIADETYIASVFRQSFDIQSSEQSGRRKSKSKKRSASNIVLDYLLTHVVQEETPLHVARVLLSTLSKVDTEKVLAACHSVIQQIIENFVKSKDCSFDQSQMLLYFIQKFTPRTAGVLKTEPKLCEMFLQLLTISNSLFPDHVTPQEAVLNQITVEYFKAIGDGSVQCRVFRKLTDALMETSDPKMSTKIRNVLKRIPISADQIVDELNKLVEEEKSKARTTKKSKAGVEEDWPNSLGLFWQKVIAIVEVIQSKDTIDESQTLLPVLFNLLSMCLEMSSQSSVDYLKQILLSAMLNICQTYFVNHNKVTTQGVLSESHFSVEKIIHCIRVSENPQTHHHALCLLAIGAKLFPEKVLHNIMSIFTFMGVSVLRQDDCYSFQVIQRTVEAVIPALLQAEKNKRNVQSLVTKVIRVFVDAFPHVPEHRRLPLFVHLMTTIGASSYLHVCLALLLEKISNKKAKSDAKESGLVFCNFLCSEFSSQIQMLSLVSLLKYLGSLPEEKPEGGNRKRYADSSGIVFDVNTHSGKELHHFKLCAIELILSVLGPENLVEKMENTSTEKNGGSENFNLSLLEESLKYVSSVSKSLESNVQDTTMKYLRILLHKIYRVVEKVCDLLPRAAFVRIISQLVQSKTSIIRRKSMDIFNNRMSKHPTHFSAEEMEVSLSLLEAVMLLLQSVDEPVGNKQSAFNTVVVLSKLLDDSHKLRLKKMFPVAIQTISSDDVKAQVASSALNCLAELCSVLTVHSIPFLPKFLPLVLQRLESIDSDKRSDVVLRSALMVLQTVIRTLPNFISPYLKNILVQLMSSVFIPFDEDERIESSNWNKQIVDLAVNLRADIAVLVKPRILIPNVSQCYEEIVLDKNNKSLIALYQVLDSCIGHMTKDDVKNHHNELMSLFVSALDYRTKHAQGVSEENLLKIEEAVIGAFISLIMRLSESLFRPMFLKLVDWATRSSAAKPRQLVFYHLADRMAEKLKGLFVLFAGYLIKNTANILNMTNITKTDNVFFAGEYEEDEGVKKSCQLLDYVLDCLYKCFLYDNQRFVNKERFDHLLKPLLDQIENLLGDGEMFDKRVSEHLAPCIAQFAVAAGDETYWKSINHEICLKTRHSSSLVRLAALKVVQELNCKLGEEYLVLLPEIVPFLAELMEDESFEVEQKCQQVISQMEEVLGESLQKYF